MKTRGAGDRKHRIQILKRSLVPIAGSIESQPTYTPGDQRWAAIEPLSARELLLAAQSQVYAEATTRITMAWPADVTHADQIKFGSRTYELIGNPINREEANRELVIMAVERT